MLLLPEYYISFWENFEKANHLGVKDQSMLFSFHPKPLSWEQPSWKNMLAGKKKLEYIEGNQNDKLLFLFLHG